MSHLSLDVRQGRAGRRMQGHVGEDQPLLVVVLAEDLVIAEIKSVTHAESAITKVSITLRRRREDFRAIVVTGWSAADDLFTSA